MILHCQLWDLRTNKELRQFTGHGFDTVACAFVPPASTPPGCPPLLATASKDCRYGAEPRLPSAPPPASLGCTGTPTLPRALTAQGDKLLNNAAALMEVLPTPS